MDQYNQNQIFDAQVVENIGSKTISRNFVANVFLWMFVALGVSAAFAFLFASNTDLLAYLFNTETHQLNMLGWLVMLSPLGFVMLMSFGYQRLSAPVLTLLFLIYAAITGISLSFILLVYTATSVLTCFLSAAGMFGVMAVMGYTTNKDLTSFGRIMMMGLIGIIIASIVNFFAGSATLNYLISFIGVMVFTGLTAYDVQKIKRIGAGIEFNGVAASESKKLSIIGALNLYLDFINLFLFLLRLFGGGRKD